MSSVTWIASSRVGTMTSAAGCLRLPPPPPRQRGGQPVQDRHAEGQRLAGAGARLADDVLAVHGQRQRERLDRERCVYAGGFERAADDLVDTEIAERHRMRWLSCQGFLRALGARRPRHFRRGGG